mmetsp:Transcript_31630/g.99785  ORF Transcript_31630/g.99785 Transcript_31630/m.99785 type:complete len:201 (+) Transcript_31630:249-851(+)
MAAITDSRSSPVGTLPPRRRTRQTTPKLLAPSGHVRASNGATASPTSASVAAQVACLQLRAARSPSNASLLQVGGELSQRPCLQVRWLARDPQPAQHRRSDGHVVVRRVSTRAHISTQYHISPRAHISTRAHIDLHHRADWSALGAVGVITSALSALLLAPQSVRVLAMHKLAQEGRGVRAARQGEFEAQSVRLWRLLHH